MEGARQIFLFAQQCQINCYKSQIPCAEIEFTHGYKHARHHYQRLRNNAMCLAPTIQKKIFFLGLLLDLNGIQVEKCGSENLSEGCVS